MVAVAAAVLIGYAVFRERGYIAFGGEVVLEGMCIAYAVWAVIERGVEKCADRETNSQTSTSDI